MSFQPSATRQGKSGLFIQPPFSDYLRISLDQSRKVLEEIQMQKKLLKQGAAVSLNPTPAPVPTPVY